MPRMAALIPDDFGWDFDEVDAYRSFTKSRLSSADYQVMKMLAYHLVLALPCEFWSAFRVSTNSDNRDFTAFERFDFPIHDFYRFFDETQFLIDVQFLKGNRERLVY
ncbi:hypothetical protein L1987_67223 [Smallanthus sonchifolius]|uniref:Uncharacterized protein n=1 Tax=Smallanthus sonchifolius TaxID=185202 RepID=A0ACB9BZF7_9ASTR|nr:hypothetical protein L1987_67223 [Smallanthus sonchifolius]